MIKQEDRYAYCAYIGAVIVSMVDSQPGLGPKTHAS